MSKIQEIFSIYGDEYLQNHYISSAQLKTLNSIRVCQTPQLGGFVLKCPNCNKTVAHFNSCRNKNCPICQGTQQAKWAEKQMNNSLPINYFHVVFTMPSELNSLVYLNQKLAYSLLFKAASQTLLELLKEDKKYLNAEPGITAVLHTSGQKIQFHPHLHCIVTGGGLSSDKSKFIFTKNGFLLPMRVVSDKFKGKFIDLFKKEFYTSNTLVLPKKLCSLFKIEQFFSLLKNIDWVVFCKEPFESSENIVLYLSKYTHKIAITDSRIIEVNHQTKKVTFRYKDYKDNNKQKTLIICVFEFIRRFLLHVVPSGVMKIRHYGLLGNRNRNEKLALCRKLIYMQNGEFNKKTTEIKDSSSIEPYVAPHCKRCGHVLRLHESYPIPILNPVIFLAMHRLE